MASLPALSLASLVAASACHPAFCTPTRAPAGADVTLIDGGLYDNTGLHGLSLWRRGEAAGVVKLIIVDPRRHSRPRAKATSRLEVALRAHDLLIDRLSAETIAHHSVQPPGAPRPILLTSRDLPEALGRADTDLRPLMNARTLHAEATERLWRRLKTAPTKTTRR